MSKLQNLGYNAKKGVRMPRHEYEQKLTRLQKIITMLYDPRNKGEICAKELAKEFNVSLRTLRRDVEAMGSAYSYHKDKIHFSGSPESKEASPLALMLLKSFAYSLSGDVRRQILSLLENLESQLTQNASDVLFTRANLEEITLGLDSIATLQRAIRAQRIITFSYKKEQNRLEESSAAHISTCEVLPLKILSFESEWYLLASESGVVKKFYLNSMSDIATLEREVRQEERVESEVLERLEYALNAWFMPTRKPFIVRLWVDSKVAKYFKRKKISPNQHLEENPDGSLDITLSITDFMEIAPLVMMWIPNVIVLEPVELREFIKRDVRAYVEQLEKL